MTAPLGCPRVVTFVQQRAVPRRGDTGDVPTATLSESLIALLAMGVVALICRWVFSPARPTRVQREVGTEDYGLLVPVTRARSAADAVMLRDHLVTQGVRASVNADHDVLVFQADLDRARSLVT